jgi:hypothetical protein
MDYLVLLTQNIRHPIGHNGFKYRLINVKHQWWCSSDYVIIIIRISQRTFSPGGDSEIKVGQKQDRKYQNVQETFRDLGLIGKSTDEP